MNLPTSLTQPAIEPPVALTDRCLPLPCGPSIARRLSRAMALLMFVALGVLSVAKYSAIAMRMEVDQLESLQEKGQSLTKAIGIACESGEAGLLQRMTLFDPVRSSTRMQLWRGDGTELFRDDVAPFAHSRSLAFEVPAERMVGGKVRVLLEMDTTHDHRIQREAIITLLMTTLFGSAAAGFAIQWLVRRELRPLLSLARQMDGISPRRLDQPLYGVPMTIKESFDVAGMNRKVSPGEGGGWLSDASQGVLRVDVRWEQGHDGVW